jgi:hypothetical protein
MPRGTPKAGFRKTRKLLEKSGVKFDSKQKTKDLLNKFKPLHVEREEVIEIHETDHQIETKLRERFSILAELTDASIDGNSRALIVSGPPGLGKSFTVEKKLAKWDVGGTDYTIVKGMVGMTGLVKLLYQYRHEGKIIVFDDADSVFEDLDTLNMLKCVCDTTETRVVSYLKETKMVTDDGEAVERQFVFEGTIIFITNLDFDGMINRGHRLTPHFQALMSRAHYVDLAMRTKRDYMIRIKQVVKGGMLKSKGCTQEQEDMVLSFIEKNQDRLRETSLRIAIKIANLILMGHDNWERVAEVTCCRNT